MQMLNFWKGNLKSSSEAQCSSAVFMSTYEQQQMPQVLNCGWPIVKNLST